MYMRMVHATVKKDQLAIFQDHYDKKILPALQDIQGCLYAGLMRSAVHPEECISMTLWTNQEQAHAYEQSGVFRTLLDGVRPYMIESTESRVQLSADLQLEYVQVPEEPEVESYAVKASNGIPEFARKRSSSLWLRIVSLKIKEGKKEEFTDLYEKKIIPRLRAVPGCNYVFLTASEERKNEVISVTIWDSKEAAEDYQKSGLFMELLRSTKHTLSDLYRWKLEEEEVGKKAVTSDDLVVEGFDLLTGKSFLERS